MTDLHRDPPMTLRRMGEAQRWLLPVAAGAFVLLAIGAAVDALPWDRAITEAAVDARSPWRDDLARRISFLGSTPVVLAVALAAASAAWRRCPRLAMAIIAIALARPLVEFGLKELVARERPVGDRLVQGTGPSFPSGHVLATVASWGQIPLVAALYTRRRVLWWAISIGAWTLAVLIAWSRVWLGVHWFSDVAGGLLLAILGVAAAERFIVATHGAGCGGRQPGQTDEPAELVEVDQSS